MAFLLNICGAVYLTERQVRRKLKCGQGLTPELSRAAKRRRLGRIVRADVTAEAAEPQAATPRTKREPLTGSRVTRRPRLEEPKPERRPTEARTLASESAKARTTRRDNTRARTRRSVHRAWRRRTRAVRSDASEARSATREPLTNADPAKVRERRARCSRRSPSIGMLFPRPNT